MTGIPNPESRILGRTVSIPAFSEGRRASLSGGRLLQDSGFRIQDSQDEVRP